MLKIDARPSIAALHEPLGVAAHAVRRAQPKLGSTVVVQGSGAIGLFTLGLARWLAPPARLWWEDQGSAWSWPRRSARMSLSISTSCARPEERIRAVLAETPGGLGADVVYGCVGKAAAWTEGVQYLRDGDGRFLEVGWPGTMARYRLTRHAAVAKNATFIGALGMAEEDSLAAVRVIESQRLPLEHVVSHQLPLERVADAITALNGDYRLDGRTAIKIAIAPNGSVP